VPEREERSDPRSIHRMPVEIEAGGGAERYQATSRNLSLGGMFLETEGSFKAGSRIKLRFQLPAQKDSITTDAEVRWCEDEGIGVQFVGLRARDMWALTKLLGK